MELKLLVLILTLSLGPLLSVQASKPQWAYFENVLYPYMCSGNDFWVTKIQIIELKIIIKIIKALLS